MYVVNLKWSRKKAIAIIVAAALILAIIVLFASIGKSSDANADGRNLRTNEDRIAYLASLGWECDPECAAEKAIVIPREFNEVYTGYNELQLSQGFDLNDYRGMEVNLYAYQVLNHPDDSGTVFAQIIVCGTEVIGGDVHSISADGFMLPLKSVSEDGE